MKKKLQIGACVCLMLGILTSCNNQTSNNSTSFDNSTTFSSNSSGYISTNKIKAEIYCWKIDNDSWKCGALMLTSINKSYEELKELQDFYSYTLEEMKSIISTYSDEDRKMIYIFILSYPLTKDNYVEHLSPDEETLAYLKGELGLL